MWITSFGWYCWISACCIIVTGSFSYDKYSDWNLLLTVLEYKIHHISAGRILHWRRNETSATFIKPDQFDPWIKDQLGTISCLQVPTSCVSLNLWKQHALYIYRFYQIISTESFVNTVPHNRVEPFMVTKWWIVWYIYCFSIGINWLKKNNVAVCGHLYFINFYHC